MRLPSSLLLLTVAFGATVALAQESAPEARTPAITREVQQDVRYQVSVDRMARVAQLLRRAQEEARASQDSFALPGFQYDLLQLDIKAMLAGIEPVLIPEKRRLRYEVLVPEGPYFKSSLPQEKSDAARP